MTLTLKAQTILSQSGMNGKEEKMRNWNIQKHWDYKLVEQVLDYMDFELLVTKNESGDIVLKLHDLQGANLRNIENEEFETLDEVMARLDGAYCDDYFRNDLYGTFNLECDTDEEAVNTLLRLPEEETKEYSWDINAVRLFAQMWD